MTIWCMSNNTGISDNIILMYGVIDMVGRMYVNDGLMS